MQPNWNTKKTKEQAILFVFFRPPGPYQVLSNFSDFSVLSSDKIMTTGNMYIHVEAENGSLNAAFDLLLDLIDFGQYVNEPTVMVLGLWPRV